jgi:oxaloacetate decarboxylase alpha subunit/pyruvate carboxylase subunit B
MSTEQMLPTLDLLDQVGFGCLETWGGATIDAGLRFLKEFPFKRLDSIRAKTKTPHMMLLRGQNIVAYAHLADDVVQTFVQKSLSHGMNIMRIFDALNDTRNMRCAIDATKKAGGHAQGTICYTKSPVHTMEKFIQMGEELEKMGCDSIVIKDMAGLIPPYIAAEMIKGLKARTSLPIWIHTHDTAGIGASTYLAAIDAGVDAPPLPTEPRSRTACACSACFRTTRAAPIWTWKSSSSCARCTRRSTLNCPPSPPTRTKSSTTTPFATRFPAACFPTSATS